MSPSEVDWLKANGPGGWIDKLRVDLQEARAKLALYRWRPISEAHEDHGACVYLNINDPGTLDALHVCDPNYAEEVESCGYTHFKRIILTNEEAEELLAAAPAEKGPEHGTE